MEICSQFDAENFLKKDCIDCGGCSKIEEGEPLFPQTSSLNPKDLFYSFLESRKKIIFSLSPQSRSSLATYYNISNESFVEKLISLLSVWNIDYLFDTSFAAQICLFESLSEFLIRKKESLRLPMLSSNCPGFVSYAEVSHDYLLPYISNIKSPQQVMGALVKNYFCKEISLEPSEVCHVTIMPCLDKRNESSRKKFSDECPKSKEVDLVLTTEEFLEIIIEKNIDFMALERGNINPLFNNYDQVTEKFFGSLGGPSDGFLDFIFKQTAKRLYNVEIDKVEYVKRDNNENFREVILNIDGEVVLRFGAVYGFRNIQQVTKLMKQNSCDFDFLEVMACPSGCTNGGGQLKPRDATSRSELIEKVNAKHNDITEKFNEQVPIIIEKWFPNENNDVTNLEGRRNGMERIRQLHTDYQPGEEKKRE